MSFNTTEEIIEDIRAGRMVILLDDEDRENEGDLVMAASHARAEDINFMASHGRGLPAPSGDSAPEKTTRRERD